MKYKTLYPWLLERASWAIIMLAALIVVLFASQLNQVKLDASSDSLTLENDQGLADYRKFTGDYDSGDFLLITYTAHDDLFTDEGLLRLKALRTEIAALEGVESVISILDAPLINSPKMSISDLVSNPPYIFDERVDREMAKQELIESPLYKKMVLSDDKQTTAMMINLEVDHKSLELAAERSQWRMAKQLAKDDWTPEQQLQLDQANKTYRDYRTQAQQDSSAFIKDFRQLLDGYRDHATIHLGGVPMIASDMIGFIGSDLVVFGSGVILMMIVLLALFFKQWQFVVAPVVLCLFVLVVVLGVLGALDWRMTVISSNFLSLLLIITLSMSIHILVRFRELTRIHPNDAPNRRIVEAMKAMFTPCLYATLTTVVAFTSLVVSDIRPVIDFGWMMTMGLAIAFASVFLLLPAMMHYMPNLKGDSGNDVTVHTTQKFAAVASGRSKTVVVVGLVLAVISAIGISRITVENRFIDYFDESTEIYKGMELIDRELGGTTPLEILIMGEVEEFDYGYADGDDDPFADVEVEEDPFGDFEEESSGAIAGPWFTKDGLDRIEAIHTRLEEHPAIGKVQSLAMGYQVAQLVVGSGLDDFTLALIGQELPDNIRDVVVEPFLSEDGMQTRISIRVIDSTPNLSRLELVKGVEEMLLTEFNYRPDQIKLTGMLVLYNNMLQSLFKSQILTLGAVFIGILIMFVVLFRSLSLSLIAIFPNLLAASVVLGGMGFAQIPLDMMTITIAAVSIGIGVDQSIHYIVRFRRELAATSDYAASIKAAHSTIGKAVYFAGITIVLGFSILVLSNFMPTIYFGLLTGAAMLAAMLGSLILLPALLMLFKPLKVA